MANMRETPFTVKTWPAGIMPPTRLIHGPQGTCTGTQPRWTSRTDVSQRPPEWCYICWRGQPITMGASDGRPKEIFVKWSSRTACNPRGTISGTRCVARFMHAEWAIRPRCVVCHSGSIWGPSACQADATQTFWTCQTWLTQSRRGWQDHKAHMQ